MIIVRHMSDMQIVFQRIRFDNKIETLPDLLQDAAKKMQEAAEKAAELHAYKHYLDAPDRDGEVWTKVVDGRDVAVVPPPSTE